MFRPSTALIRYSFLTNAESTTVTYTLSLHDALPIYPPSTAGWRCLPRPQPSPRAASCPGEKGSASRSEEHTSELQSRPHLVCRLLLEKKKKLNRRVTLIMFSKLTYSVAAYSLEALFI